MKDFELRRRFVYECLARTVLLLASLALLWPLVRDSVATMPLEVQGNVLQMVGLLLAGSVSGAFAFSHGRTNLGSAADRLFGHVTRLLLNGGIGLLLQIAVAAMERTPGAFNAPIYVAAVLVYGSVLLYDAWDALRLAHFE